MQSPDASNKLSKKKKLNIKRDTSRKKKNTETRKKGVGFFFSSHFYFISNDGITLERRKTKRKLYSFFFFSVIVTVPLYYDFFLSQVHVPTRVGAKTTQQGNNSDNKRGREWAHRQHISTVRYKTKKKKET